MDRALERVAARLEAPDRRLAQELAYGVLRLRGRLDYTLDGLVDGGIGSLHPDILDILRLGAYQLLELDRVPVYAAVSDAVDAAADVSGGRATGLVNAVLRRLDREGPEPRPFPSPDEAPLDYLSSWGSHPRWLVERWLRRWTRDAVEELVSYNNRRPMVYLTVIGDREEAIERLAASGMTARPAELSGSSIALESGDVTRALQTVDAVVQDPAAAAVVDYIAAEPGRAVVDLCAAPGGKAAVLAGRGHDVFALDIARTRLPRLLENRGRLAPQRLRIVLANSEQPPLAAADVALLDVPCTGTGTLGRHPDARWRLEASDLERLIAIQRRLLDATAALVRPGGWLVYATCSIEIEENEDQVEAFLKRHPQFGLERPAEGTVHPSLLAGDGTLRVLPQRHAMDGVYAARLRRS